MNSKLIYLVMAIFIISAGFLKADKPEKNKAENLSKTAGTPMAAYFNINNISTIFTANGESDNDPATGDAAFDYPKGSNKYAFFQSGFLWGAKVLNTPGGQNFRMGGSSYVQGQVAGRINGETPQLPEDPDVRIYRVRPDALDLNADFSSEILTESKTKEEVAAQYALDWNEWPAKWGAPYEDVDGNGVYDPNVDTPGIKGADQTLWYVSNDLNDSTTISLHGSLPIGLEIQTTIWGYNREGALGNTLFRKYTFINKGGYAGNSLYRSDLDSIYICMWSDPDLGDATDDYAGCDTMLNLGFVYNAIDNDIVYSLGAPAAGFGLIQGPIVDGGSTDFAKYKGHYYKGKKNLPMTQFLFFLNSDSVYKDPPFSDYAGTIQYKKIFEGKAWQKGEPFKDPTTGYETKFPLAGNPVTGTGWIDGIIRNPGDRRIGVVSGPFKMSVGDTQEIVLSQIIAGGSEGIDRLEALDLLKEYSIEARKMYDSTLTIDISKDDFIVPELYQLGQNYPNPFNPATTIDFRIYKAGNVKITVYDALGKELEIITNQHYASGSYKIGWNASRYSSGVYFYRLESSEFTAVKKMILLK